MDNKNIEIDRMFTPEGGEMNVISVTQIGERSKLDLRSMPNTLPVLALRQAVVFPGCVFPITVGRPKSLAVVTEAEKHGGYIAAIPQIDPTVDDPHFEDLCAYGTVVKVARTLEMPDGTVTAIIQAFNRVELMGLVSENPVLIGRVRYLLDQNPLVEEKELRILMDTIRDAASNIVKVSTFIPKETLNALKGIDDLEFLVNFIATTVEIENFKDKLALLGIDDVKARALRLLKALDTQLELLKIKQEINSKVRTEIDQQQREHYLNSQLRTIQEELGMDEMEEFEQFREEAAAKPWGDDVAEVFEKEMAKLQRYNPSSPEYSIEYNYIRFMLDLPWGELSADNLDLKHAREVLDKDHYGLDKVKERIIEYLAVLKLKGNMKSPILCLYGPPGVGKTSLGKSIARALGRQYQRISLGGLHDESEIRGHRKTYIGAMPGRVLSCIQKAGTNNPVIVLDEIDKIGTDYKGDPSSALLEVLDPEQNVAFHDNYLDIDYDLSNVLFITTANEISTIQPALKDRMEMIDVTGYLEEEKEEIARHYLVPKQVKEHGLKASQLKVSPAAIRKIIEEYTSESGVRSLEKQIAKLARVTAKKIALEEEHPVTVKPEHLKEYLGLPSNFHDSQKGNEGPGVVTGLAWTQMGGEILFIESSVSPGKGNLSMTGNLGDVMKESATIAYQYIKAHTQMAGLTAEEFAAKDVHIHVPEGAVPKDGPSAGITIVTSMISAFRCQAIRQKVAMTGEMTLRGKVLPVGGIKEKILAAKRAGVQTIVISEENRKDVEDIKEIYVKGLDFHYVKTIEDVVGFVFE
ncbi:MAG: endopeptidase La [Bacteroidales bacterium]|nr:endopeptidase La [Bacteroidales bacterium]